MFRFPLFRSDGQIFLKKNLRMLKNVKKKYMFVDKLTDC